MQRKIFLTDRLIYYITFFTGFSSAIIQAVLIREMLSVFRGNELLIGIIFSAWFLGIFIGARYNPESDILRLKRRVLLSLIFFPFVSVIMIYLPHSAAAIFPVPVGSFYSIKDEFLFSLVLTVPASFFTGYIFPPLVSLISDKTGWKSGGRIYYIEAFGGFAGGLLFSFIFIDILNPLALCSIIIFAGIILFAAAVKNYKFCVLLLIPLILFISSGKIEKIFFSYMWEHSHPGRMLEYRRTKYQTVTAESGVDSVSIYGDGIYFYTLPDRYEARMLFHLLQSLTVKSNVDILLTGAAPGSLLSNFLRSDTGNLTYIEMDSGLWEITDKYRRIYYPAENENRLKIIKSDLRHYFSATDKKFDMIVCLPPPPENAMLNRYYTREFYSMCRDHLKTGGVFVTSIFGFSNYISPVLMRYMRSVYRSFAETFPYTINTSGETIYLIGAVDPGSVPEESTGLINRYKKRLDSFTRFNFEKELIQDFNPRELMMLFEESQLEYFKIRIEKSAGDVEPNTDLTPNSYWNKILISAYQENSFIYNIFSRYYIILIITALAVLLFFRGIKKSYGAGRTAAGFMIFIVGFTSISSVILLVIIYQNFYGVIFYRISLINALYMLGLASGSFLGNKFKSVSLIKLFFSLTSVLFSIIIFTHLKNEALFWGIIFFYAVLCGMSFPLLFSRISDEGCHMAASLLDSVENSGAIIGSLLTPVIFVPAVGIIGTIYINIGFLLSGIIFWKLYNRDTEV